MKFAARVAYNGTLFSGWQIQKGQRSVQEEIEEVLSLLNGGKVKVTGAGRTDAGVHACGQVCSFYLDKEWDADKLLIAANANLPEGVQFIKTARVSDDFDARRSAASREYVYFIWNSRSIYPHLEPFVCHLKSDCYDWALAIRACSYLEGTHDFKAFCKKTEVPENSMRNLYSVKLYKKNELLWLHVKGNAFLTHMVRVMLGNLELVARKKRPPEWIKSLFDNGEREDSGKTFPAKGLFFWQANYKDRLW